MASVPTSQYPGDSPQDYTAALDQLSQLTAGNQHINTHPGLMGAIAASNATPQQAQEIDQYMAGVRAQNMMTLAHASGARMNFSDSERNAMDAMGVDYSAVDQRSDPASQITLTGSSSTGGAAATTPAAAPAPKPNTGFWSNGILHGLSRIGYDTLHNPVTNTMGEGLNVTQAALSGGVSDLQSVEQQLGITQGTVLGDLLGGGMTPTKDGKYGAALHAQRAEEMKALGYNPDSFWSGMAFDAHGYRKIDVTPALNQWDQADGEGKWGMDGMAALKQGMEFLKDPKAATNSVIQDQSLTPEQVDQKLNMMRSPEWEAFTRRLGADDATFGHQAAYAAGLDPIKNPVAFNATAAGTDLVASFYIDPTMALGKVVSGVAKLPTAIDSLNDSNRIAAMLDPSTVSRLNVGRQRVINGWQSMIDSTNKIREGLNSGDMATVSGEYASIAKKTPALLPLVGEFIGKTQGALRTGVDDLGIGITSDVLKNVVGEPVTNLAEAAKYVTATGGLQRLAAGKAAVESSYMPGAVSNWGFRALKANRAAHAAYEDTVKSEQAAAGWVAARDAGTLAGKDQAVVDAARAKADPMSNLVPLDMKRITKFLPDAADGIDSTTGLIVASPDATLIGQHVDALQAATKTAEKAGKAAASAETGVRGAEATGDAEKMTAALAEHTSAIDAHAQALADLSDKKNALQSALRAAGEKTPGGATWGDTLLPAEKGQIAYNMRRYGSATAPDSLPGSIGGWASPAAVAARARLAMARFSNLAPVNTTFDLNSAATADKVRQYARFYLGKGQANLLAAQFAGGDLGTRKAIVQGLLDQVGHAAGLPRTTIGQDLLQKWQATGGEVYTHVGDGWEINGQQVALHRGEIADQIQLPGFKDLHHAASKVGLYEGTVGRLATSTAADHLFNPFRLGILMRPATYTRNAIEEYAKAIMDGHFGNVMRARALTFSSSEELAKMGEKLGVPEMTGKVPDDVIQMGKMRLAEATASGSKHDIAIAQHTLDRIQKGDIAAMAGYGRTRVGSAASDWLAHLTRFYHTQLLKTMPEGQLRHVDELPEMMPNALDNYGEQRIVAGPNMLDHRGIRDQVETGLQPVPVKYNLESGSHPLMERKLAGGKNMTRTGFGMESTDHTLGTDRYVNALNMRTYAAPETSKAVVAALRDPEQNLDGVIKALDKEQVGKTAYGQYFKPEDGAKPIKAITPDDVALGKRQWAQDVVNDYKYLLTGQDGNLSEKLMDHIAENGSAPGVKWFDDNISKKEYPKQVLAPQYEAMPVGHGPAALASALNELGGKAFNQIVEGPLKRQGTLPFLSSHYLKAREEQDIAGMLDKLTEHGLSPESADTLLKGQALRQAYVRTAQMIDDPGQKTQFDTVARNLLMFPRAMEAFMRRWGGSLAADPFKARKMMLALEASEHSGFVYRDQNGELTFTYPGSAVMRDAMSAVSMLPGFSGLAKFPVGMDMTGKLLLTAPGFNNPLRFSMSPMINIPMRGVFSLFPEHESIWNEIDTALNGSVGASQAHNGALASIEPSSVNKLIAAMSSDDKNAVFASAVTGAIAHLTAAGLAPSPDAPLNVQDAFKNQVKAQVRNQLFLRFAFGLVAPAAPSKLNENIPGSAAAPGGSGTASDYEFNLMGIKNLGDEYKSILDSTNGDVARASAIFVGLHPEGIAYTVGTTGTAVNKAYLPATQASLNWMEQNLPFLDKYKTVAAYFMPKETGKFDGNAYQAQVALGMRQSKTIDQYYQDVQVAAASDPYYKMYDEYTAAHQQAVANGDKAGASEMSKTFAAWKTQFLNQNLALKEKFATSSTNKVGAEQQMTDLQSMVDNHEVPDGLGPQVKQMVDMFTQYNQWKSTVPATAVGNAQKQAMAVEVDSALGQMAATSPVLTNLFNAVFRTEDPKLTTVTSP